MNDNLKHYQAINALVTNALLALYVAKAQQGGFWTVKKRNECLVKFIKPKLKRPQFSSCKYEIKTMLNIGRSPKGNLERKLWEVNQTNLDYRAKFSHADELYIMLTGLFEQHQFTSMLENPDKPMEMDSLYMEQKGIEAGFDEDNHQVKPLPMSVKTHRLDALIDAMQANGLYRIEVDHVDEREVTHLLLHRKSQRDAIEK